MSIFVTDHYTMRFEEVISTVNQLHEHIIDISSKSRTNNIYNKYLIATFILLQAIEYH